MNKKTVTGVMQQALLASMCIPTLQATEGMLREQQWRKPIPMNRFGVTTFFSDVFNSHGFGAHACAPLTDFLAHSKHTSEPVTFSLRILDLFHTRIKETSWLNGYDVNAVLKVLHEDISPLIQQASTVRLGQAKRALYNALLTRFRDLKTDPDHFIHDVANDILAIADASEVTRLRTLCIRFIESMLDRLIWSPEDQDLWALTKDIASSLYILYEDKVLPDAATLNHILWSLVYRLCYEIETAGEDISLALYQAIKEDISTGESILFSFPDNRDGLMISRAQWMRAVALTGEVRAQRVLEGNWVTHLN